MNLASPVSTNLRSERPTAPLSGDIRVPGDKSMSHRALILGGLASGETSIQGLLEGDDVLRTAAAVRMFGADVQRSGPGSWVVRGSEWYSPSGAVDCGNSGTGVRLLMGAASGFPILATFTGDQSLKMRPMERVLAPLRAMGAMADGATLPVTIHGGRLKGCNFVNETASAQVKSAILLAGLRAEGEVTITEPRPSRDHSENMLRAFGCDVHTEGRTVRLGQRRILRGTPVRIPCDPSSAAFPIVAALLVPGSTLTIRDVLVNPLRAGLFVTLGEMGAKLRFENEREQGGERIADVSVEASDLDAVEVPASRAPAMIDEYPILAIAAALAKGTSRMHGLAELRVKESNRLLALVRSLRACGVEADEVGDSLIIKGCGGPPPGGNHVCAHGDHRIAMSFLIMGLCTLKGITVDSGEMISTSFPGFALLMQEIGATIT